MTRKGVVLAIDVDGVVLDYAAAYRQAWARAFGILPDERDPQAYWPHDRWAVRRLDGEKKRHFRRQFDEGFWSTIPALPGAVSGPCQSMRMANVVIRVIRFTLQAQYLAFGRPGVHCNARVIGKACDMRTQPYEHGDV